jgi:hypothetical protein
MNQWDIVPPPYSHFFHLFARSRAVFKGNAARPCMLPATPPSERRVPSQANVRKSGSHVDGYCPKTRARAAPPAGWVRKTPPCRRRGLPRDPRSDTTTAAIPLPSVRCRDQRGLSMPGPCRPAWFGGKRLVSYRVLVGRGTNSQNAVELIRARSKPTTPPPRDYPSYAPFPPGSSGPVEHSFPSLYQILRFE